jgi:hypothetical protein
MSRTDIFNRYAQIYQKARSREIVPEGAFVRQLTEIPKVGLDIGVFFKTKEAEQPAQVYIGEPIPRELARNEGFLETERSTYFSKTLLSGFRSVEYLKLVLSARRVLHKKEERVEFLKKCQGIIDLLIRKARNVILAGDFAPFAFDTKVKTLEHFLSVDLAMDEVSVEAATIPFNLASPQFVMLTNNDIIVMGNEPSVPHGVFFLVGGLGYVFDKKEGAITKERIFKQTGDLSAQGIDSSYIERVVSRVTEDFQTQVHSIIFSDIWKKSEAKPMGVNFEGDMLIKAEESSDLWTGVFEVYLKPPRI